MKTPRLLQYLAYPQKITGPIIEAELRDVAIGELCEIRRGWHQKQVVARAQVVGLQRERTVLVLYRQCPGAEPAMSCFIPLDVRYRRGWDTRY